jgi:nicotinate-nucleotide pyrophosphorylase
MKITASKSKSIPVKNQCNANTDNKVTVENVKKFKYLGIEITSTGAVQHQAHKAARISGRANERYAE